MIEEIESKIGEILIYILEKPAKEITKNEFDILSSEFYRLKMKIDAEKNQKNMMEIMASIMSK